MKKVFVSGCYDIIHAGHLAFFKEAKALGDHLTVCFASDEILWIEKKRRPSIPIEHKKFLIQALEMVDDVVIGKNLERGLDFKEHFLRIKPNILAVTEDDKYKEMKHELCSQTGTEYRVLPKTPPKTDPISSSDIVRWIRAPREVPLRVDFAGGWLDVPRYSRVGGYIVNCAITPLVSLNLWEYEKRSGLGGSAAWSILNGENGVNSEINLGVGWQDPAIIQETGLCVWHSGLNPELYFKRDGKMLKGLMAIHFSNNEHDTPAIVDNNRNYDLIYSASQAACQAALNEDISELAEAIRMSYVVQIEEGMNPLVEIKNCLARKYCGGGWGGYALYLFSLTKDRDNFVEKYPQTLEVEPFINNIN